ncbi:hypothetical protein [Rhodobacter ferrooxidans]|uniref:Uncharacterized protein n=1 Tax=Rhodobacter ferrooxidans TaxID=371731 RepID=C8RZK5_9RHOB|nr:hypothetical protein [Rhodobacter sp. SW2]EEW25802.1 conserved hypothetical protein [Rhodobacter sp. SW2]
MTVLASLWDWLRAIVAALLERLWRAPDGASAEARLKALPQRSQALIVGCVLLLLFVTSLIAAEFGWIGMLVFFLAVIALVY